MRQGGGLRDRGNKDIEINNHKAQIIKVEQMDKIHIRLVKQWSVCPVLVGSQDLASIFVSQLVREGCNGGSPANLQDRMTEAKELTVSHTDILKQSKEICNVNVFSHLKCAHLVSL